MQVSDATEALEIEIDGHKFAPKLTYQVFEEEKIFGHTEPKIKLSFNSAYTPLYEFSSSAQEEHATDIKAALENISGPAALFSRQEWEAESTPTRPLEGTVVAEWDQYAIRRVSPEELRKGSNLLTKLQILVLLFIEGGSYIDQSDNNWIIYFLTRGTKIVGFCTVYPYFYYEKASVFDSDSSLKRERISQFLILPPYQRQGLGTKFLKHVYTLIFKDPTVKEITVEDPTEEFDTIRERVSLELYDNILGKFASTTASDAALKDGSKTAKIDLRSFQQLYEMYHLKNIGEDQDLKALIKGRIWRQNYLELKDDTTEDKREKLEIVYQNVVNSYNKVIGTEPASKRLKTA